MIHSTRARKDSPETRGSVTQRAARPRSRSGSYRARDRLELGAGLPESAELHQRCPHRPVRQQPVHGIAPELGQGAAALG